MATVSCRWNLAVCSKFLPTEATAGIRALTFGNNSLRTVMLPPVASVRFLSDPISPRSRSISAPNLICSCPDFSSSTFNFAMVLVVLAAGFIIDLRIFLRPVTASEGFTP